MLTDDCTASPPTGTRRVTEGEIDRVTVGGGIQNALSRVNIFF